MKSCITYKWSVVVVQLDYQTLIKNQYKKNNERGGYLICIADRHKVKDSFGLLLRSSYAYKRSFLSRRW